MRRLWVIFLPVILAGAAFWGTYAFLESPYWSLYQIGRGIHNHQASLVMAYVDVETVLRGQEDQIADLVLGNNPQAETKDKIKGILGLVMTALAGQARQRIAQYIEDPDRENIPTSWTLVAAADVTMQGDKALILMENKEDGDRIRLGMIQAPQGHWVVNEVNSEDLKDLIRKYGREMLEKEGIKLN